MTPKLLFNCVPPAFITMPAPAFSVLKSFLEARQINCKVYYWNLQLAQLQKEFLWAEDCNILASEIDNMLLFFNYLAVRMSDQSSYNKVKGRLIMIKPHFVGREKNLFDEHMRIFADRLDKIIDKTIDEICSEDIPYYGFSANLYQWVASSIIAGKIKAKYPHAVILLGGIGNKNTAVKFMENFIQFDFALWGEGENALYELVNGLDKGSFCVEHIPNIVYRKQNEIALSGNRKVNFADLSDKDARPDYKDFFEQIGSVDFVQKKDCDIPIETSRGCHWNRCHFCFLNMGYLNRLKDINQLVDEIKCNIGKFQVYKFNFLDNDIINNDYQRFDYLLEQLIKLRFEFPDFLIQLAEIITKGINQEVIKKMSIAGFVHVQIGYESPSDNLLKKIEKKNTFASNLLFIKFASKYKIRVGGANVIRGLLEEKEEHVMEGIANLHSLRFFLRYGFFQHNISSLAVVKNSRYYKKYPETRIWKRLRLFADYIPKAYLLENDTETDVIERICTDFNPLWDTFQSVEAYYLKNNFKYQLLKHEDIILYKEYFNETPINELAFEQTSLDWYILTKSNSCVYSYNELLNDINSDFPNLPSSVDVIEIIEGLKGEGLIYASDNYSELVSIIDIDLVV